MAHYLQAALLLYVVEFSTTDVISNRYCADMRPQHYVTIEQLLGMWYGVEIINHKQTEDPRGIQYVDSCPIIHISKDNSPTVPPYYSGANVPYGTNYGTNYQEGKYRNDLDIDSYTSNPFDVNYDQYGNLQPIYRQGEQQGYQGRRYGTEEYPRKYTEDIKRLRILWTDNGREVEYTVRYNVSKPGFWLSSGPQNGSYLEPQFNYFAGTVQVIKAVGNHLVLTFCHQLPDQRLYTLILARMPKLTRPELSDVHDLLTKRALEITNVKKVCTGNNAGSRPGSGLNGLFACVVILVRTFRVL